MRPANDSASQAGSITTMAAVAMCEAIEAVSDEKAEIKWVNDIFACCINAEYWLLFKLNIGRNSCL